MAQEFTGGFYNTQIWKKTRAAYKKSVGGLCERCLKKGLYRPAVIVHHKAYITAENLHDAHIALDWNNLEALCRECHEEEHSKSGRRYSIAPDGTVEIR